MGRRAALFSSFIFHSEILFSGRSIKKERNLQVITFKWIFVLIIVLIVATIQFVRDAITKKWKTPLVYILRLSFTAYICVVLGLTLLPFIFEPTVIKHRLQEAGDQSDAFSFIPFASTLATFEQSQSVGFDIFLRLIGGNLIMLLPLGIYIPILWRKFCTWKHALGIGLIGSGTIEFLQFLMGYSTGYYYRTVDIDDVLYNTLGALLGYFLYQRIRPHLEEILLEDKNDLIRT